MLDQDAPDQTFNAMTARLLRREALRRAVEELNTTSKPGLEEVLARISADVTTEAAYQKTAASGKAAPGLKRPGAE
jgi:phage shock protein A